MKKEFKSIECVREHALYLIRNVEYQGKKLPKRWTFTFDNAKRRFGVCRGRRKIIGLSKTLVLLNLNDYEQINDTILHEMAHAFDYEIRGKSAHDNHWKMICREIGAKPQRCFSTQTVEMPKSKYTAVCSNCKTEVPIYRKPKRDASCGNCCRTYNPKYKLTVKQNY